MSSSTTLTISKTGPSLALACGTETELEELYTLVCTQSDKNVESIVVNIALSGTKLLSAAVRLYGPPSGARASALAPGLPRLTGEHD